MGLVHTGHGNDDGPLGDGSGNGEGGSNAAARADSSISVPSLDALELGHGPVECQRRAFVIRIAGNYSPGVQREIFNALHSEGVDILDANIASVRADDSPDADISMFINNFTVLSRGAKKDFDSEKLEEMHHALTEILNNDDAQIIFEPLHEDYSEDGILEVQIIGEYNPHSLHELTDVLADLKLDVIKAQVLSSEQPGHSVPWVDKPERSSKSAPAASPDQQQHAGLRRSLSRMGTSSTIGAVLFKSDNIDSTERRVRKLATCSRGRGAV